MKTFFKITLLVVTLSFAGCWNMYNDALDDQEAEYKHFLIVTSGFSDTKIDTFPILSNGTLDFNNYKTVTTPAGPIYPAMHPNDNFLYVPSQNTNTVLMYRTMNDGSLISIGLGSIGAGTNPGCAKVHPSGKFLYVGNSASNTISMYSIDNEGILSGLTPSTISSNGLFPYRMAIDPTGNYLFVVNIDEENIVAFSINNSTGELSYNTSFKNIAGRAITSDIQDIIVDSNGRIYLTGSSGIFLYNWPAYLSFVESNFVLLSPAANNRYLALNPSGKYLYYTVGNMQVNARAVYSDGSLSDIINSVSPPGGQTYDMIVHPSGKYIYLAEWGDNHIYYITINNDGTLTQGPTNIRFHAYGLAIFRKKIK
jgi:6-phosphogluconolactonase